MSLVKIRKYIEILVLLTKENITRSKISKEFKIPYTSLDSLFKRWMINGFIERKAIKEIKLGGDQFTYHRTQKGTNYLLDLLTIITKDLGKQPHVESEEYDVKEILKEFSKELPDILANFNGELEDLEKLFLEYIKREYGIKIK